VIVLDLTPPREGGAALLQRWYGRGGKTHVLALTRGGEDNSTGSDLGADDYLAKPFRLEELLARLRALVRRGHHAREPILCIHDLEIDTDARAVKRRGQLIHLTPREYSVLELLAFHRGEVVPRTLLWEHLTDKPDASSSNVINVYIRYLRKKIDGPFSPPLIQTRRGEGYLLRV
jgi:DNA-binding response OmpR family regulator